MAWISTSVSFIPATRLFYPFLLLPLQSISSMYVSIYLLVFLSFLLHSEPPTPLRQFSECVGSSCSRHPMPAGQTLVSSSFTIAFLHPPPPFFLLLFSLSNTFLRLFSNVCLHTRPVFLLLSIVVSSSSILELYFIYFLIVLDSVSRWIFIHVMLQLLCDLKNTGFFFSPRISPPKICQFASLTASTSPIHPSRPPDVSATSPRMSMHREHQKNASHGAFTHSSSPYPSSLLLHMEEYFFFLMMYRIDSYSISSSSSSPSCLLQSSSVIRLKILIAFSLVPSNFSPLLLLHLPS